MQPVFLTPLELNLGPLAPEHFSEVIVGIVVVLILWFLFAKFVSPNFEAMFEARANEIEGGIMRAERAQDEAALAKQQYEQQLESARTEAAKVREDAKNQGALILAQMREQATKETNRMMAQAKAQIEADRQTAEAQLRTSVGGMATTLAGRIVGESLTDDERAKRAVDRFIAELEAQPSRTVPDYPEQL